MWNRESRGSEQREESVRNNLAKDERAEERSEQREKERYLEKRAQRTGEQIEVGRVEPWYPVLSEKPLNRTGEVVSHTPALYLIQ